MVQPKNRNSPGSSMIPGTRTETLFGITHEHFFCDVKKGDIKSRDHRNGNQDIHLVHGITLLELETAKLNMLVYRSFSKHMQTLNKNDGFEDATKTRFHLNYGLELRRTYQ